MLDHIASSVKNMTITKEKISEKILNHALEIIYLLTGEKYVLVKKSSPHCCIHPQSGTVPVKCDDVAVYFSMEEWDYVKGHEQQYQNIISETEPVSDEMDTTDVGVTPEDNDSRSPDLADLNVKERDYETASKKDDNEEKDEGQKVKSSCELSSERPGTSAAESSFRSIIDDTYPITPLLDESEIKVKTTEEIKDNGTNKGLANKVSTPDKVGTPHHRWRPNFCRNSERFIFSGNRTYNQYRPIKPASEKNLAESSRLQFINQVALEKKPFQCIACGQTFKSKPSTMRHYSVVHGLKPHQCNECGRRFSTKFATVVHKCNPRKNAKDPWDEQGGFNV